MRVTSSFSQIQIQKTNTQRENLANASDISLPTNTNTYTKYKIQSTNTENTNTNRDNLANASDISLPTASFPWMLPESRTIGFRLSLKWRCWPSKRNDMFKVLHDLAECNICNLHRGCCLDSFFTLFQPLINARKKKIANWKLNKESKWNWPKVKICNRHRGGWAGSGQLSLNL